MLLRRRPTLCLDEGVIPAKTFLLAHLNLHPDADYEPVGHTSTGWIGAHRRRLGRQLVMVQEVSYTTLTDFSRLARIAHVNIARPIALYHIESEIHLVYEYVDLDLFDALPLSQPEIAAVMTQVMNAVSYLTKQLFAFRIDTIRVCSNGVVKIVLDWNFEPTTDSIIREANNAYLAAYLDETMTSIEPNGHDWTRDASAFLSDLRSGNLPIPAHPYLAESRGRAVLQEIVRFAVRRKLATT